MAIYGFVGAVDDAFRKVVVEQFHFTPRPDALAFRDGDRFDLGGVTVRAVAAPGHTRGHTFFVVEPDGVVYLGDVDLSTAEALTLFGYLLAALVVLPLGFAWSLAERSRGATAVLAVVGVTEAFLVLRATQIWPS